VVGVNIMCTRSAGEGSSKLYSLLGFASFFYFLYASCNWWGLWNIILFLYDLVWVLVL
jgi:hypothetical protein